MCIEPGYGKGFMIRRCLLLSYQIVKCTMRKAGNKHGDDKEDPLPTFRKGKQKFLYNEYDYCNADDCQTLKISLRHNCVFHRYAIDGSSRIKSDLGSCKKRAISSLSELSSSKNRSILLMGTLLNKHCNAALAF